MTAIAPGPRPLIREIALSRLALAPENVRKTPADPLAEAELEASIAAHGLLENLVVRPEGQDPDNPERYAVVAGGRRLAALKALADHGMIDADHPVPCLIAADPDMAGELSLAENVVRIAMHPADQIVAFTTLADAGLSIAAIAARFGLAERLVEQRLRLGNAAPELLEAYRAGDIDIEVLKAFAVTTDRERQMAVWEQVSGQGYRPAAWQVKRMLTEERVPGSAATARFVGAEAYEAAGGRVLRDLFARDDESGTWFEDPALLEKLATGKLQTIATELAERWKWVLPMIEVDWRETAQYGRIEPRPAERTADEQAEIATLEARQAELAELDDEDWTEDTVREAGSIEERLDEIEAGIEARAVFTPEDLATAGCIATVGRDGTLQLVEGLVRPEDMPKRPDRSDDAGAGDGTGESDGDESNDTGRIAAPAMPAPMTLPGDREKEARKEAGVGIGLADDLRSIRTALVKARLAGDFEAAFDLMLFQLGRSVFIEGYRSHALDITVRQTADRPMTRFNDEDFAGWSPGEAMLEDRSGLAFDWLDMEDDGESFAALRALPQADKQALFAACVARTVKGQLAFEPQARPELEATVARLDIDFAAHVRPTADMYWSRITKGRMLDIARAVLGPSWASARSKSKKPVIAEAMEQAFASGDRPVSLSAQGHAAALAWSLPGFAAFDTGRIDDEDGDAAPAKQPPVNGHAGDEPDTAAATAQAAADPPRKSSVVESIEAPAVAERRAAALAAQANGDGGPVAADPDPAPAHAAGGNGHDAPTGPAPTEDGGDGGAPRPGDHPLPADIAEAVDTMNAVPTADGAPRVIVHRAGPGNGHDNPPDPLEIPAFLRRS